MKWLVVHNLVPEAVQYFVLEDPMAETTTALEVLHGTCFNSDETTEVQNVAYELLFGENGKYKEWLPSTVEEIKECKPDKICIVSFVL